MSTRRVRTVTIALGTLALAAAPYAAAQDTAPPQETRKPWTQGTTHAANEVVGARSGLGFSFVAPPQPDFPPPVPDFPELTISASVVAGLVQVVNLQPPPVGDFPPGPTAIRIRLWPPGPTSEARLELHILDATSIEIFGPNGSGWRCAAPPAVSKSHRHRQWCPTPSCPDKPPVHPTRIGRYNSTMTELAQDVLALRPAMIALRRAIHEHPELAYAEEHTAQSVVSFLEGHGLRLRTGLGGTGVLATAEAPTGPRLLLRVDMDGLPIQEETATSYASKVPGRMHACGHDGHVAMGAATARLLPGRRLPGTVDVLFQPAEEGEGGAQAMVAAGVLEGVDMVMGVHLWNELPVGTLGVKAGPLMAAVDRLRILVHGHGGHGAKPHLSADPVVASAHVITALQTIVAREVSPLAPAVVTIASVHGGEAFNVIPDSVTLTGTIRTFDAQLRRSMPERVSRIASGVAAGLGCRAEVEIKPGNPAVVNDPLVAEIAARAAARVVGPQNVVTPESTMGGEDMAVYFEHVPGCFVFVGSANAARGLEHPHHSPRFDFDEDALGIGCAFLLEFAGEALSAADTAPRTR